MSLTKMENETARDGPDAGGPEAHPAQACTQARTRLLQGGQLNVTGRLRVCFGPSALPAVSALASMPLWLSRS